MNKLAILALSFSALTILPGCQTEYTSELDINVSAHTQTDAVINAYFEGLNKNDISDVPFAENAVLLNPMLADPVIGADDIKQLINGAIGTLETANVKRRIVDGENACVMFDYVDKSGLVVNIVDCFVVKNGEIVDLELYYDPRRFLELAPPN